MALPLSLSLTTSGADTHAAPLVPFSCMTGASKDVLRHIQQGALSANAKYFLTMIAIASFGNAGWQKQQHLPDPGVSCRFDLSAWARDTAGVASPPGASASRWSPWASYTIRLIPITHGRGRSAGIWSSPSGRCWMTPIAAKGMHAQALGGLARRRELISYNQTGYSRQNHQWGYRRPHRLMGYCRGQSSSDCTIRSQLSRNQTGYSRQENQTDDKTHQTGYTPPVQRKSNRLRLLVPRLLRKTCQVVP